VRSTPAYLDRAGDISAMQSSQRFEMTGISASDDGRGSFPPVPSGQIRTAGEISRARAGVSVADHAPVHLDPLGRSGATRRNSALAAPNNSQRRRRIVGRSSCGLCLEGDTPTDSSAHTPPAARREFRASLGGPCRFRRGRLRHVHVQSMRLCALLCLHLHLAYPLRTVFGRYGTDCERPGPFDSLHIAWCVGKC
jgi:hypothetical protein